MEKIEIILTNCIKEIRSGKATLAECLNCYPSYRQELEPLLKMALSIHAPPALKLDQRDKQIIKAQLLQQIRAPKDKKPRSFTDIFSFGIPSQFAWARVVLPVLILVILLSSVAGGTAYASQSSLPGDTLYPVKTASEDARVFLAGDTSTKVELNLKFARTRLEEMKQLVERDEAKALLAVNGYKANLEAIRQQIGRIPDLLTVSNLLDSTLTDIQNQTFFCDNVIDSSPIYARPANEAGTIATEEQINLIEILNQKDNLRAAQINLKIMQDRLQRAQEKAATDQYQTMQESLLQYQQFELLGERILQGAQVSNSNSTEIEALSLQSLTGYLDTLDRISQHAPQQYKSTIEASRQATLQFQNQAQYRYQYQEGSGQGPQSSPPENGSGSTPGQNSQSTTPSPDGNNIPTGTSNSSISPSQGTPGSGNGSGNGPGGDTGGSGGTGAGGGTDTSGGNSGGLTPTGQVQGSTTN